MKGPRVFTARVWFGLVALNCASPVLAQKDPGPRSGPASAGSYYPTLQSHEQTYFSNARTVFQEVETVTDSNNVGLGPALNSNSCSSCHAEPAIGGSSPGKLSKIHPVPNPQVALATLDGAQNTVPSFISVDGPMREARFIRLSSGAPDGGVHDLFTIAGRADAPGCTLAQPDFASAVANHNIIFRIPTPVFGLGLVENTPDPTLLANFLSTAGQRAALGIQGTFNTSGNDGTITRFGWKAQNKSLLMFAGEAYNVEMGISNELFPNKRAAVAGCVFNPTPDDDTNILNTNSSSPNYNTAQGSANEMSSDIGNFAAFMRLSAPPTPTPPTAETQHGAELFSAIGCVLCHSATLTTAQSYYTGMSNVAYHPYSDFAIHHMGQRLADGVSQGSAGPDQFRTAPLWGAGQRLFFLHDGRTSDLLQAIQQHSSSGSEANRVVERFNRLHPQEQQAILDFVRSL
jgi:CxxC motif-containing protein (DUF1111 family)